MSATKRIIDDLKERATKAREELEEGIPVPEPAEAEDPTKEATDALNHVNDAIDAVKSATDKVSKALGPLADKAIFASKDSDLVAPLYRVIKEKEYVDMRLKIGLYEGRIIQIETTATKMSGLVEVVETPIQLIMIAAALWGSGHAIDSGFIGTVSAVFSINEDGKLSMLHVIPKSSLGGPLNTAPTILDPDLLL